MSDATAKAATGADREARDLLESLVATPSPSGEEDDCAAVLVDYFRERGREAFLDGAGNVRAPGDDAVLLTSHVDTVPGDIPVRVADEDESYDPPVLWGRGSVDAKGPLATMAVVAARTGVSFAGVVGEETDSRGARHLVERRDAPDAVINGEPSGWDGVTLGYRGILQGTYVATSESGHTSRPGPNAIQEAIGWWSRVEAEFESEPYEPVFEQVTTKPVGIEGGTSADGLSVEATLDVQLRVPPALSPGDVRERADALLERGHVNWHDAVPPVTASPRNPVARAFRASVRAEGGDPRLLRKTGTSDMNLYAGAWDCPMATYGPGDSDLDHAPDERLSLPELDRAVSVLTGVIDRL
ncbi:MAG: [LysW]-lysine hydrolase [Haloarculaceae archaeon]